MWRVEFEPGEVKVVARKDGKPVREQTIRTAGAAERIGLSIDYQGNDLTFVAVDVLDAKGTLCPLAEHQIFFAPDGLAILGVDNG